MSRLIITLLNPGFIFTNMKEIQNELNPIILKLIPDNCTNLPCPYLTDGDEIGERILLKQTKDWLIEEYKSDDETVFRRLILTKNLNQIQSQFRISHVPEDLTKPKKKECKSLLNEKKGCDIGIDSSYLDFDCHKLMVVGLALMENEFFEKKRRVLVLGGGLCAFSNFLKQHFQNFMIETIEINQEIIDIAKEMFDLKIEENFKVICDDAWVFVKKTAENLSYKKERLAEISLANYQDNEAQIEMAYLKTDDNEKNEQHKESQKEEPKTKIDQTILKANDNEKYEKNNESRKEKPQAKINESDNFKGGEFEEETKTNENLSNKKYDLIIIDINSDDVNELSPPARFLSPEYLRQLKLCLNKNGMLFINFINKEEKLFDKYLKEINEVFHLIYSANIENEYNTVIYAKNLIYQTDKKKNSKNEDEEIIMVQSETIYNKKLIESNYKNMVKHLKKSWDQTLNLESFLNSIILQYPNLNKNPFEKKNAHLVDVNENATNNTKEMYIKDLEKISKNKKKKKKNKMR